MVSKIMTKEEKLLRNNLEWVLTLIKERYNENENEAIKWATLNKLLRVHKELKEVSN